ncbi:MAG: N-acetylglucosamine-6-phosphate deacetylase [Chloroflexota bacterium]
MSTLQILGATLLTPEAVLPDHSLLIENGRIASISSTPLESDAPTLNARGFTVIPGLIDIHTHGGNGADVMDATPEAIYTIARFLARHGVTSYLPTTITASPEATRKAIANLRGLPQPEDGAQHLGVHLEGPYLCHEQRGAQPEAHLRNPDPAEYTDWFEDDLVRLITLAPELEGAEELIRQAIAHGVEIALGHTAADEATARNAINLGVRQATHIFSGMPAFHHRLLNVLAVALTDDRLYAQAIVDGIHIHPDVVRMLTRVKTPRRLILISDSIRAAGLGDGEYDLGGETVRVQNGITRRAYDGGLAGSTLTLDAALRNVMKFSNLSLAEALPMATSVPAEAMGWSGRKGVIRMGADADLVFLDDQFNVCLTMVNGRVVYQTQEF